MSPYKHLVKFLIFAVILIRLFLITFPSFQIDMSLWFAWASRMSDLGPNNFYSSNYFSDYFPGYLYILWIIGETYNLFFNLGFEFVIKSVTTLFDLATSFYIFKIVIRYKKSWALTSSLIYLANPALIFNTSVWGQIDGLFTFFLVFAAYQVVELKKFERASFLTALAILIKPQSLAILPVMATSLFKTQNISALKSFLIIPATLIILSIPFFINDPLFGLFKLAARAADVYPYNSLFAFNFWSVFGWWQKDSITFLNSSYRVWGVILYSFFLLLVLLPIIKRRVKINSYFYFSSSLSFFIFYLFLTRMHERYLFPFFAFLLLAGFINKSKLLLFSYLVCSIIHFLNLYYVYYYYNYVYTGLSEGNAVFNFVDKNYQVFGLVFLFIFIMLLRRYRRYLQLLSQK